MTSFTKNNQYSAQKQIFGKKSNAIFSEKQTQRSPRAMHFLRAQTLLTSKLEDEEKKEGNPAADAQLPHEYSNGSCLQKKGDFFQLTSEIWGLQIISQAQRSTLVNIA